MLTAYLVEFFGTLLLTFVILSTGNYLAIGATLAICILFATNLSKQAFNPAVVIALVQAKKLAATDAILYIIAQILGAIVATRVFMR